MRMTVAIAAAEAILVFLWIASFVHGGAIGSSHQYWYVEIPIVFLVVPFVATTVSVVKTRRMGVEGRTGFNFLLILLLLANLIAFFVYGLLSGGGV
jgi:hypothetical protein